MTGSVHSPVSKKLLRADMIRLAERTDMQAKHTKRSHATGPSRRPKANVLGRHIVADSGICGGKPTFRGTRILVADVLGQVARGMAWETIVEEWRGAVSMEAIAEAVHLAREALVTRPLPTRMTGS
jgi:uncharacterized protein (DUF433 family)